MIEKYSMGTFFMKYRVHESTESGYKAKDQSIKRNSFTFKHHWRETPTKDTIIYYGVHSSGVSSLICWTFCFQNSSGVANSTP